jgi:hypothetical protein
MNTLESLELGGGWVDSTSESGYRLNLPSGRVKYADAQLDDYRALPRDQFRWRPPLRLNLNARASSSQPPGTLGFGFWNDPFTFTFGQGGAARRMPALPQAAWFFYGSPPNDLSLGGNSPGAGWLAMTMRSKQIPSALLALPLLPAWLATRIRALRPILFHTARKLVAVKAQPVGGELGAWHRYVLDWQLERVEFYVDDQLVLTSKLVPHAPLGFVAWIDNQYLCASPLAGLRFGVLLTGDEQWLELEGLSIRKA